MNRKQENGKRESIKYLVHIQSSMVVHGSRQHNTLWCLNNRECIALSQADSMKALD